MTATQQHPNILGAIAALNALRTSWRWLDDLLEPGTPTRRHASRNLSPASRARLNHLARAERADLTEIRRHGLVPVGATPAPLVMPVLDAQLAAFAAVTDAAWLVTSHLRERPMLAYVMPAGGQDDRFHAAAIYLNVALRLVDPDLAGILESNLDAAGRTVRQVTGEEPNRVDLTAACPACGRRSLVARTWGTADATVTCDRADCRCRGVDCLCRRPFRTPGLRHIWPAAEFGQLDRLLGREVAAA